MEDARHFYGRFSEVNVVLWNTMILGYAQREVEAMSLELYAQMHQKGVMLDHLTSSGAWQ